jgi:hypothetical protein
VSCLNVRLTKEKTCNTGFPYEQATWEPPANLPQDLIQMYEAVPASSSSTALPDQWRQRYDELSVQFTTEIKNHQAKLEQVSASLLSEQSRAADLQLQCGLYKKQLEEQEREHKETEGQLHKKIQQVQMELNQTRAEHQRELQERQVRILSLLS